MSDTDEDRVRERAYAIWEDEGKPEGEHLRHWSDAEDELRREAAKTNLKASQQIEETESSTGATGIPTPPTHAHQPGLIRLARAGASTAISSANRWSKSASHAGRVSAGKPYWPAATSDRAAPCPR